MCTSCGKARSTGELFHRFPVKRKDVCRRWEISTRLLDFRATESSLLCSDHFESAAYIYPGSKKLKDDAIPTVFTFSESSSHNKEITPRKPPMKRLIPEENLMPDENPPKVSKLESPSKEELRNELTKKDVIIFDQKKKIKLLQQQVRRKNATVTNLRTAITVLKEKDLLTPKLADNLLEAFPGLDGHLIVNHLQNKDRDNRGNRYTDAVKKFSLTAHFYSPRAFDYLRTIFNLPDPRSLRYWTSSVSSNQGFSRM